MIELTRLGLRKPFLLNPDLIERIESNVDTVVRLTNGVEYVVVESGEEIVERIIDFRARVLTFGPVIARPAPEPDERRSAGEETADAGATVVELPNREQRTNDTADPSRPTAIATPYPTPTPTPSREVPR